MKHLFVDISAHGFGHLAQTAPVLNALLESRTLRLTVRSGLSQVQLARRIRHPFTHIHASSDFGFIMHDALRVDRAASAECYRSAHADRERRIAAEVEDLRRLAPDLVLSNISPLPLAGAARAGIPAIAMSSLNWADLFAHYFGEQDWAAPIHAAMLADYASAADFLRLTPGMQMPALKNLRPVGPVSAYADATGLDASFAVPNRSRDEVAQLLDLPTDKPWLLIALGGIAHRLPVEAWPHMADFQLLTPADWQVSPRADVSAYDDARLPFAELLPHVDALISKPGYGTFVEAASCGLPVLYLGRPDWPESAALESWLHEHTRAAKLPSAVAERGEFAETLTALLASPAPKKPNIDGIATALRCINARLDGSDTMAA